VSVKRDYGVSTAGIVLGLLLDDVGSKSLTAGQPESTNEQLDQLGMEIDSINTGLTIDLIR
jgi:hypothetical protein